MWIPIKEACRLRNWNYDAERKALSRGKSKRQFRKVEGQGGRDGVYEIWIGENDETKQEDSRRDQREIRQGSSECSMPNFGYQDTRGTDRSDRNITRRCTNSTTSNPIIKGGKNNGSETNNTSAPERCGGVDKECEVTNAEFKIADRPGIINDTHINGRKSSAKSRSYSDVQNQSSNMSCDPREALKLSDKERQKAELKCALVLAYLKRPQGMIVDAFMDELSLEFETLEVTPAKLNRWAGEYKKAKHENRNVIVALADGRGRPKGGSKLTPEMQEMTIRYLLRRDVHLNISGIYANLQHAFVDALPSYNTVDRFIKEWKEKNVLQWAMRVSPDKAKSKYMPAYGSYSENVKYKNQVWELDGTVADVVTADGRRWLIVGAIDVYSRRVVMSLEESNTSFALARNMRKGLIKLGIPDMVITDNGKDYTSNHFSSVCLSLGIEQKLTRPYSGDEKGHIERFFGTMSRELFRSIDGFCGASVAERQAIQSGLSFEQKLQAIEKWKAKAQNEDTFRNMFRKKKDLVGLSIEVPLFPEELESWIDRWVEAMYERKKHGSLNMSPLKKWENDFTPAKTVGNLQSLDFLLGETKVRTIGKKGVAFTKDGIEGQYWHPIIAGMDNQKVNTIEPDDMGELLIYTLDNEFVCIAEDPTLKGKSREEASAGKKIFKKLMRQADKAIKAATEISKDMGDPLIMDRILSVEEKYGLKMPELRTPKVTDAIIAANEAVAKSYCEEPKINTTRKWETMYDRFLDKMLTKTWDEKDTALAEKYPDLYEMALDEVEKRKKVS